MKLQLALDGTLDRALELLEKVHTHIDLAEVGTPLIFREGVNALHQIRAAFPNLSVLADFKIMDAGYDEATIAFEAGASWVTVLAAAHEKTIHGAMRAAREHNKNVMVDLIGTPGALARARQILALGTPMLCVHTAYDLQGGTANPLTSLAMLRNALPDAPLAVAGGIGPDILDNVIALRPNIVIVGGAIASADDPAAVAAEIHARLQAGPPAEGEA